MARWLPLTFLRIIMIPPALLAGLVMSDAAVAYGVPLSYYIATLTALGSVTAFVIVVLKFWTWTRGEWKKDIGEMFATHSKDHDALKTTVDRLEGKIDVLPCQTNTMCRYDRRRVGVPEEGG
jgi:hypothetical protein